MIKFGTGGWRALIGEEFTKTNVKLVAHAISYLNLRAGGKPIVVGYDNRFLSREAADWVIENLNINGIDTYSYNTSVPTPLVMWQTKKYGYDYGIMISASHNPYNYNGIKVFVKGGVDAPKEVTNEIEKIVRGDNGAWIPAQPQPGAKYLIPEPFAEYTDDIFNMVDVEAIKAANLPLNFNGMHGSASKLFMSILQQLNCDYNHFATDPDAWFSTSDTNTPEPTLENIGGYVNWINTRESLGATKALSLIFDGDGDRLMVLDEDKNVIDMNTLLCIYYWYLHEYRHETGAVIKNVVTTRRLDKMAEHYGEQCIEVPVGFKYVTEGMHKYDALIGGESSGGFTYRGHVYGKDSIMASLMLLEVLAVTKLSLSEIINKLDAQFGKSFEVAEKLPITENLPDITQLEAGPGATRSSQDGVKFTYSFGWGSIRKSGTEPILRVMVEADTQEHAEYILNSLKNQL